MIGILPKTRPSGGLRRRCMERCGVKGLEAIGKRWNAATSELQKLDEARKTGAVRSVVCPVCM